MQIWPAIDLLGGKCVRLQQGDYQRETRLCYDPHRDGRQMETGRDSSTRMVDLDGAKDGSQLGASPLYLVAQTGLECVSSWWWRPERGAIVCLLGRDYRADRRHTRVWRARVVCGDGGQISTTTGARHRRAMAWSLPTVGSKHLPRLQRRWPNRSNDCRAT